MKYVTFYWSVMGGIEIEKTLRELEKECKAKHKKTKGGKNANA